MNRLFEILICLFVGIFAFPVLLLACCLVWVDLGRPILFWQTRSGKSGKTFDIAKLRTMREERDASGTLLPDAERQTRISVLVRRLRLDEIPQLWLILRGRMALVGPRPLLPETIDEFGETGRLRSAVRPGLTGWSQVSGNTTLSNEEKLRLDLWYVSHRSTALDLRILWETLGVALFGEKRRPERLEDATRWLNAHLPKNSAGVSA